MPIRPLSQAQRASWPRQPSNGCASCLRVSPADPALLGTVHRACILERMRASATRTHAQPHLRARALARLHMRHAHTPVHRACQLVCSHACAAGSTATKRLAARLIAQFCTHSEPRQWRAIACLLGLVNSCLGYSRGSTAEATLCDALQGLGQICAISHSSQRAGPLQLAAQALIRCITWSELCLLRSS